MTEEYRFHQYLPGPFKGDDYLPSAELAIAVNTALAAEQPLLVTGLPGTGKTQLAASVAKRLNWGEVLTFVARSDHQARDCLYSFDNLGRLYDAQANDARAKDPKNYRHLQALGKAISSETRRVVLIDEIDKAPRDFPNDLLGVLEGRLEFIIQETREELKAPDNVRPLVIITSNLEQPLPAPFLRRCVFHNIAYPGTKDLETIVQARFSKEQISEKFVEAVVKRFGQIRDLPLEKKPATGELLTWVKVLLRAEVTTVKKLNERLANLYPGVLLKIEEDLKLALDADGKAGSNPKEDGSAAS